MSCLAQTCTCNRTSACMHCRAMQDCFLACTTRANACNFTRLWSAWNARLACQCFNHKTQENIITALNKIAVDYTCYIHDTRWPLKFAWIVIAAVPSMVSSLFEDGEATLIKVLSKHWNWEWCLYEMTGESFCELRLTSSKMPLLAISWFSLLLTSCSTKSNVLFAQCLLTRGS